MTPIVTRPAGGLLQVLTAAFVLALLPAHTSAQSAETSGGQSHDVGPVGVHAGVGWQSEYDDNVFRTAERPISDIISTLSARADVNGQAKRLGIVANGTADWVHYATLLSQRGANAGASVRLNFLFNRVAPYVGTSYRNSRNRVNPEIDTRPRNTGSTLTVGSVVHLGAKTGLDVSAAHGFERYDSSVPVEDVDLSQALNRSIDRVRVSLDREITPLTFLTVEGELRREQFETSTYRDTDVARLTTGFSSQGRIRGHARVGMQLLKPRDPRLTELRELFLSVGTNATLYDRLQLGVEAQRDVVPSFRPGIAYYGSYSFGGSLAYAMRRSLRLSAMASRRLADYQNSISADVAAELSGVDKETRYGGGISLSLGGSTAIDLTSEHTNRSSIWATRRFESVSFRVGVNHAF